MPSKTSGVHLAFFEDGIYIFYRSQRLCAHKAAAWPYFDGFGVNAGT
jgi:hypothetical protein